MPRRTKEDAEKTRQAILASALDLFSERGIGSVSLAQIAEEAGVTRGAVYWHFSGKAQILEELWEELYPTSLVPQGAAPGDGDYLAPLAVLIEGFLVKIATDSNLQKLLLVTLQSAVEPKLAPVVKQMSRQEVAEVTVYLERGQAEGQVRPAPGAEAMALLLWGAVEGFASNWLYAESSVDLAAEAAAITAILIEGIRQPVG